MSVSGSSTDSQSTLSSSASSDWSKYPGEENMIGGHLIKEANDDEDGYTKLHNTPGQDSMDDLREWKTKNSLKNCCNCSIM